MSADGQIWGTQPFSPQQGACSEHLDAPEAEGSVVGEGTLVTCAPGEVDTMARFWVEGVA